MAENVCRNCKWAEWQMTAHVKPRINKRIPAKCLYPMTRVAVPVALDSVTRQLEAFVKGTHHPLVWFDYDDQCRVWERKDQ